MISPEAFTTRTKLLLKFWLMRVFRWRLIFSNLLETLNVILLKINCLLRVLLKPSAPLVMSLCLLARVLMSLTLKVQSVSSPRVIPKSHGGLSWINFDQGFSNLKGDMLQRPIIEHLEALGDEKDASRLTNTFSKYLSQLFVVGFNSG